MSDSQSTHRPPFKAGDLLFFSGRGWLAAGIKFGTLPWLGYSHVGLIVEFATRPPFLLVPDRMLLVDATTVDYEPCLFTDKTSGCRARTIPERIKAYQKDGGQVYHFPIKRTLLSYQVQFLERHARTQLGKPYDYLGAWRCRSTPIAWLMRKLYPNTSKMLYCAESSARLLGGRLDSIVCEDPEEQSPNSLAKLVTDQDTHGPAWRCE